MRPGVRIGVDVGTVRVGVAASDASGVLASPVSVLRRRVREEQDLDDLATLVRERDAVEVVVGLPRTLRDQEGAAAMSARAYANAIAARVRPIPVRLVDERLSTVTAQRAMAGAGRSVRSSRSEIDAAAAVVILQSALDTERATGRPPGEQVQA